MVHFIHRDLCCTGELRQKSCFSNFWFLKITQKKKQQIITRRENVLNTFYSLLLFSVVVVVIVIALNTCLLILFAKEHNFCLLPFISVCTGKWCSLIQCMQRSKHECIITALSFDKRPVIEFFSPMSFLFSIFVSLLVNEFHISTTKNAKNMNKNHGLYAIDLQMRFLKVFFPYLAPFLSLFLYGTRYEI